VGGTPVLVGICPRRCPGSGTVSEGLARSAGQDLSRRAPGKWGQTARNPPRFP